MCARQVAEPIDLAGGLYTEWAPTGATLIVRYDTRIDVRDLAANTVSRIPIARGALYAWAADGRTLLVRTPRPTVAAGDGYGQSQVVRAKASAPYVLPAVFGGAGF